MWKVNVRLKLFYFTELKKPCIRKPYVFLFITLVQRIPLVSELYIIHILNARSGLSLKPWYNYQIWKINTVTIKSYNGISPKFGLTGVVQGINCLIIHIERKRTANKTEMKQRTNANGKQMKRARNAKANVAIH